MSGEPTFRLCQQVNIKASGKPGFVDYGTVEQNALHDGVQLTHSCAAARKPNDLRRQYKNKGGGFSGAESEDTLLSASLIAATSNLRNA